LDAFLEAQVQAAGFQVGVLFLVAVAVQAAVLIQEAARAALALNEMVHGALQAAASPASQTLVQSKISQR